MKLPSIKLTVASLTILLATSLSFAAEPLDTMLSDYQNSGASQFSAKAGEILWNKVHKERSCASCHSNSVKSEGRHQTTGKKIQPMAPSINSKRLTDRKKIEKWLYRNCKWTWGRECNDQEKGDILLWLSQQ